MKKFMTVALAIVVLCTMTLPVFAAPAPTAPIELDNVTSNNNTNADVDVEIIGSGDLVPVYSVDVMWESLNFQYTFTANDEWNPDDHTYVSTGGWVKNSAKITVTNHSNVNIRAKASFADKASSLTRNGVTAAIDMPSFTLNSAVGTAVGAAHSGFFTCSISGTPVVTNNFKIGTITISFEAAGTPAPTPNN